jgi:hypothetical protein
MDGGGWGAAAPRRASASTAPVSLPALGTVLYIVFSGRKPARTRLRSPELSQIESSMAGATVLGAAAPGTVRANSAASRPTKRGRVAAHQARCSSAPCAGRQRGRRAAAPVGEARAGAVEV